jgi:hypothetical protein
LIRRPAVPSQTDDVWFIPHCDGEGCNLGKVEYTCPVCLKTGHDYGDLWWDHEDIYFGRQIPFECEHCKAALVLKTDDENFAVVEARV